MSKYRILIYEQEETQPAEVVGSEKVERYEQFDVWLLKHDSVEEGSDPVGAVRSMLETHDEASKFLTETGFEMSDDYSD